MRQERPGTIVYQLGLPQYRAAFLSLLADSVPRMQFMVGDQQFLELVGTEVSGSNVISTGPNLFLFGRRLAWQRIKLRDAIRAEVVILELNPRVLNTWLVLALRRFFRRRTLAWGHVFGRQGPGSRTEWLRNLLRGRFEGIVVYTEAEAALLSRLHPGQKSWVAANAVYGNDQMVSAGDGLTRDLFVCIGRLVRAKRPVLVLEAFAEFARTHPEARLVLIGEGPERETLERLIAEEALGERVRLLGHVTDWQILYEEFGHAVASVCGGYVGLNVVQSLGFGVPVIYPDDEPHAPEVEALHPENSLQFRAQDADALTTSLCEFWERREELTHRSEQLASATRARYSAETMASAFAAASVHDSR